MWWRTRAFSNFLRSMSFTGLRGKAMKKEPDGLTCQSVTCLGVQILTRKSAEQVARMGSIGWNVAPHTRSPWPSSRCTSSAVPCPPQPALQSQQKTLKSFMGKNWTNRWREQIVTKANYQRWESWQLGSSFWEIAILHQPWCKTLNRNSASKDYRKRLVFFSSTNWQNQVQMQTCSPLQEFVFRDYDLHEKRKI